MTAHRVVAVGEVPGYDGGLAFPSARSVDTVPVGTTGTVADSELACVQGDGGEVLAWVAFDGDFGERWVPVRLLAVLEGALGVPRVAMSPGSRVALLRELPAASLIAGAWALDGSIRASDVEAQASDVLQVGTVGTASGALATLPSEGS